MTDATQQGADDNANDEVVFTYGHNDRNKALQQIAQQAHQQQSVDLADFNEETGEISGASQPDEEPEPEPEVDELVIDGQKTHVAKDKIYEAGRRTLQKETAADKRLREATELLRKAQDFAQQVGMRPSQDASLNEPSPREDAPTTQQSSGFESRSSVDISTEIQNHIYMHEAKKAAQRFKEEFDDIAGNPILYAWVAQEEDRRLSEAMANKESFGDPLEAYRKHGEAARAKLQEMVSQVTKSSKEERKRSITAVSGANVKMPAPQPDKPKTQAQIIEDMRKARHQRIN